MKNNYKQNRKVEIHSILTRDNRTDPNKSNSCSGWKYTTSYARSGHAMGCGQKCRRRGEGEQERKRVVLDKTFGLNQAQYQIHRPNATSIGLYIQSSQTSQGMHYSNLDLQLKLILTWASERFLQVPPFCVAGHPMLGFQPPARSISSTDPPM
jgi:hypothetical protein